MSFKNLPKQTNKEKKSELILSVNTLSEFDLWNFAPNRNVLHACHKICYGQETWKWLNLKYLLNTDSYLELSHTLGMEI